MSHIPGTMKGSPPPLRRDLSPEGAAAERLLLSMGALHAERWQLGSCLALLSRDPMGDEYRWHLSISHPSRYPSWDETKAALYGLTALRGVTMGQVVTPGDGSAWVNLHDNCFHWYEIHDETVARG